MSKVITVNSLQERERESDVARLCLRKRFGRDAVILQTEFQKERKKKMMNEQGEEAAAVPPQLAAEADSATTGLDYWYYSRKRLSSSSMRTPSSMSSNVALFEK